MKVVSKVVRSISGHSRFVPVTVARRSLQTAVASNPLFEYTSGRWLWNEEEQLKARYRSFDVPRLQQAVCDAVGAERCVSLEKIGEGNYNKAYRLITEDGRRVIAKVPHPNAGPPSLTTASEVATLEFVRTVLRIPGPKVLAWDASCQNPVGAEYIIMEEAQGTGLHKLWPDLSKEAKFGVVSEIVEVEKKLLSVSFDKIGSLYFRDSGIPGCVPVSITGDAEEVADPVSSRFCVGPVVRREFWEGERSSMRRYHGPWDSPIEYLGAVVDRETDWITTYAQPQKPPISLHYVSPKQDSREAHLTALRRLRSALPYIIPRDPGIVSTRMWHPDLHAGNIFLDASGKISSIIDWQGAWTAPLFIGAKSPPLLDYGIEILVDLPDDFESLDDGAKYRLRHQLLQSKLIYLYEHLTSEINPLLYRMMGHPHAKTLNDLEVFAGCTWDNHLINLTECLKRVERDWELFDSPEPCPYRIDKDEIKSHQEEADSFNSHQEFWSTMRGLLTADGYTSNETFLDAVEALKNIRLQGLAHSEGEDRDEFDRETIWIRDFPTQT